MEVADRRRDTYSTETLGLSWPHGKFPRCLSRDSRASVSFWSQPEKFQERFCGNLCPPLHGARPQQRHRGHGEAVAQHRVLALALQDVVGRGHAAVGHPDGVEVVVELAVALAGGAADADGALL